jgi:hypothetical protein
MQIDFEVTGADGDILVYTGECDELPYYRLVEVNMDLKKKDSEK